MAKVIIDKLDNTIRGELLTWFNVFLDGSEEAIKETAKETVDELHATSPKDSGEYSKTWKWKKDPNLRGAYRYATVVYNEKNYRLTHLLEFGHALVRGGREVGKAQPEPHIESAEEKASRILHDKYVELINKQLI